MKDSEELAWRDWENSADYDDEENDYWPRKWGREYVRFAANEKRDYLKALGLNVVPTVGWAERGHGDASAHGNSVPRFHLTWGTGAEVVRVFREPLEEAERQGKIEFRFRHQVDELLTEADGAGVRVVGVRGSVLEPTNLERGKASSREVVGSSNSKHQPWWSQPVVSGATLTSCAGRGQPNAGVNARRKWCKACLRTLTGA